MTPDCKECKWSEEYAPMYCAHPERAYKWSDFNREPGQVCGPTGKLFEPKDKQEERKWNRPQEQGESDLEYTVRIARGGPKPSEPQGGF